MSALGAIDSSRLASRASGTCLRWAPATASIAQTRKKKRKPTFAVIFGFVRCRRSPLNSFRVANHCTQTDGETHRHAHSVRRCAGRRRARSRSMTRPLSSSNTTRSVLSSSPDRATVKHRGGQLLRGACRRLAFVRAKQNRVVLPCRVAPVWAERVNRVVARARRSPPLRLSTLQTDASTREQRRRRRVRDNVRLFGS